MVTKTIVQRITLEGGADIQKQFAAIGAAGQKAFNDIKSAASAAPAVKAFGTALSDVEARAEAVGHAIGKAGLAFADLGSAFAGIVPRLALVGASVVAAGGGLVALTVSAANSAAELQKTAAAVGLTTQQFQNLSTAAGQAGISASDIANGFNGLARSVTEAAQHNASTAKSFANLNQEFASGKLTSAQYAAQYTKLNQAAAQSQTIFQRLGISIRNADGTLKDNHALTLDVADAFTKLPDGVQKSSDALKIFQQNGPAFIAFLDKGSSGILALEQEAQRIAPPLSKLQIAIGTELTGALSKMGNAASSAKNSFALIFAPSITRVANALTEAIVSNRLALFEVGNTLVQSIQPAVQNVINLLGSKEGSAFFTAAAEQIAAFASATTHAVFDIIVPALGAIVTAANGVAAVVNGIFGTAFTGQEIVVSAVVLRLIGVFSLLGPAITAVSTTVGILVSLFGAVPVALFAVGAAIGVAIIALSNFLSSSTTLQTTVASVWAAIVGTITGAVQGLESVFSDVIDGISGFFSGLADDVSSALNKIISLAKQAASAMASVFGGSGGGTPPAAFAGGGHVRGPGTSTSDSIPAYLSDNEFVTRARAVRYYGVSIFNALNSMRIPKSLFSGLNFRGFAESMSAVMPGRTHFNTGGLAVAGSSSSSNATAVHLHIGQQTFPLTGAPDVVRNLSRAASAAQMRSTGRKPSWAR